jgi:DNA-binding NarL/FixJ family response regulator
MENKPRILIVDDDPDFAVSLQATLAAEAYQASIASNRAQAQKLALAEKSDMVVIGTIMPRGDAFLLHQWLKRTPPFSNVPIIVIDAPSKEQLVKGWNIVEGLQMEADDYLVKPVEPALVVPRIEKLLDKETRKIKLLVVDDHAIVREGIRELLGVQKDMQVVGEAVDGKDAVEKVRQLSPDVVLMDIVMPVMNGLEATKQICSRGKKTKVLMLSQYDDEENIHASSKVGAYGFIPKRSASTELLSAIRSAS